MIKLNYSIIVSKILELPLCFLPSSALRSVILSPMLRATQGTIDAMSMALAKGYAINIGGGFHHANKKGGEGFCAIPDISLAIKLYQKFHKSKIIT